MSDELYWELIKADIGGVIYKGTMYNYMVNHLNPNRDDIYEIGEEYIACNVNRNCLVLRRIDDKIFTIENFQCDNNTTEEELVVYLTFI